MNFERVKIEKKLVWRAYKNSPTLFRTSNFVRTFVGSIGKKKRPLKISGKVSVGVLMDSGKFSGHPYLEHISRSSLR